LTFSKGSEILFINFLKPQLIKYEPSIDLHIAQMRSQTTRSVVRLCGYLLVSAQKVIAVGLLEGHQLLQRPQLQTQPQSVVIGESILHALPVEDKIYLPVEHKIYPELPPILFNTENAQVVTTTELSVESNHIPVREDLPSLDLPSVGLSESVTAPLKISLETQEEKENLTVSNTPAAITTRSKSMKITGKTIPNKQKQSLRTQQKSKTFVSTSSRNKLALF